MLFRITKQVAPIHVNGTRQLGKVTFSKTRHRAAKARQQTQQPRILFEN